jgi:hypothetical protein
MRAWLKALDVRKIKILGDQEPVSFQGYTPDAFIIPARQVFLNDGVDIMSQLSEHGSQSPRDILIELNLHGNTGKLASGRSSSTAAAAKAITARRSSWLTVGKSSRISSNVAPSAREASIVRTGTRVPLITHCPAHILGSRSK